MSTAILTDTEITSAALAPYIQHTLIDVGVTRDQIVAHAEETLRYGFNAAMVPGSWVAEVAEVLRGTDAEVASALDFPTVGVTTSAGKAAEAESLVRAGATQIDIGVQIGWLKSGRYDAFRADIAGVVASGVPVKVMLELPLLTPAEREAAVELSIEAGAAFLKNASSGAVEVANPDSVAWLVARAPQGVQVKASGGIKSFDQAVSLLRAGAVLLGTSAGVAIVTDEVNEHTTSY
ncbi:Deoxyribose-phosphate aldolase 1 [Micromonospora sp. MW-13]|uniref:deoxyribose-phosphate aldolase n=1 Tax=unclassified Micromonospora TaxID=2617518 RepID=UPI000EDF15A2|nr:MULTISPECIES: deoxyribose-phosphate aldolase [unclassified Micromonospora]MCX4472548.1 deoxyribose-phosphate aldolase [Micromonospora sp. NBC_01655]RGC69236.1 Deoxyribose-phosphate aldolase 1 [Micromonospora sp. MW-13]